MLFSFISFNINNIELNYNKRINKLDNLLLFNNKFGRILNVYDLKLLNSPLLTLKKIQLNPVSSNYNWYVRLLEFI